MERRECFHIKHQKLSEYQKLISHSLTRWLLLYPSLPRMFQMYPALHSYFMSIHKPTDVLKCFLGHFLRELWLRYLQSFVVAFNEQVKNTEKFKASFVEDRKSKNML